MPIPAYRAKQSTNTTGTGTVVLNAAETNARNFSAAFGASSRRILYMIQWATGFEFGLGDFDGGTPGNLTRATVLASSNAGALVTLPGGSKDVFAVFDPAAREAVSISGTATLALADLGNAVVFTGSSAATLNLTAVATAPLGAGWLVMNSGTAALTIDPSGEDTVNGANTLVLQAGQATMIWRVSGAWQAALLGGTTLGLALAATATASAAADIINAAPVDIASAATTNIGAASSPNVRVTGTTPITSLGTSPAGTRRYLTFSAVLTIIYNATSLQTPGLANITTAAGDNAVARSLGSGNWVIESFTRASGVMIVPLGSVAAPSMSFSSDPDTGMLSPAANRIQFATNGVARQEIAADGSQLSVIPGGATLLPDFKCRAWVNFNGTGTPAIRASGNVSSITDNAVGDYTVNFITAMPDANYAALVTGTRVSGNTGAQSFVSEFTSPTASAIRVMFTNQGGTFGDSPGAYVAIFR
jgi:hypothetical protein